MAKVNLMTQAEYARHRGCSRVAVGKAVKSGRISLVNELIDPVVADMQWLANSRARMSPHTQADTTNASLAGASTVHAFAPSTATPLLSNGYTDARARREVADAETAEIQLKKLRGEILVTADVARAGFEIGRELRDAMESSVNSLASELAAISSADACADVLRRHNRALQELWSKAFREKAGAAIVGAV